MIKFSSLAAYALMAPAVTLGIGSALATESTSGTTGANEQRTTQEQRQMPEQSQQQQRQMPQHSQKDKGMSTADRAQEQRMGAERAKQHMSADSTYLSSAPANSFGADELIGADLKSRADDETIGPISDLVIDKDGKIAAVIVEVGGFLGLGEKEVAISWDSIERRSNVNDDGPDFRVDTTKDALQNAPEYKSAAKKY